MHPNWKALSTVDFPQKQFVRQSENTSDPSSKPSTSNGDNGSNGDEVRQFYESVLESETEQRTIKKEPDYFFVSPEPHKRKRSKLKEEKEDRNLDSNALQQAFIAAQNDNLENIRTIFSAVSSSAGLLAARDGYDWTLLMVASCANAGRVIQFLLELKGLELGARDKGGNTALDLAQKRGHQNIVKLIKAKQDELRKPQKEKKAEKFSSVTRHSEQSTSHKSDDESSTVNRYCEICQEIFSTTQDWKKHVTSMIHQLNRSKQEVETGTVRTHFVIPEVNRGFQMMLSGGWDKKGLGPSGSGKLYPVKTILKRDRHGLGLESDSGVKVTPKVTHFDPHDDAGVRDPTTRTERSSTLSRRQQQKKLSKEKAREVNFRREFCS